MMMIPTESDNMMAEIMEFTSTVVGLAEMKDVAVPIRAKAIMLAEQVLHKVIMDKLVDKCIEKSIPCNN